MTALHADNNPAGNDIYIYTYKFQDTHFPSPTINIQVVVFIVYPTLFYHWESRAGTTTNAWYMNCQGVQNC